MSVPINVELIHFGERDALHEFMKQDREDLQILDKSFVVPPRISMEELFSGSRYYICGPKGSGKTTLLWYLSRHNENTKGKVVLFKTEIRKEDRDKLDKMIDLIVVEDQKKYKLDSDYKTIWEWFILKTIARLIDIDDIVERRDLFKDIVLLLQADKARFNTFYDKFYIDRVKGSVKLNVDLGALKSEISSEIEARRIDGDRFPLLDLVRLVQESFSLIKLKEDVGIRLYFDELEFFVSDDSDGERDRRLVRDLLFSVYSANLMFSKMNLNIVVYASVRSEILQSIATTTQEVEKNISAFGVYIDWDKDTFDDHPVLQIVENKIVNSEIAREGDFSPDVWKAYFPEYIIDVPIKKYLLDNGLHRPRGVILRLSAAVELAIGQKEFVESHFVESEDRFGTLMLQEFSEEISATYNEAGRDAIFSLIRGNRFAFTREEMHSRIIMRASLDKGVRRIREELGTDGLLRLLFRIGMIGNVFEVDGKSRQRWSVRGEANPYLEQKFVLHRSVRTALSTK